MIKGKYINKQFTKEGKWTGDVKRDFNSLQTKE